MDPFILSLLLGGSALGGAGALFGRHDALDAAKRERDARNEVLRGYIAKQEGFAGQNRGTFNSNLAGYAPEVQGQKLAAAQGARTDTNVGNVSAADPNAVPITADAPKAVRGEIAKRMLTVHDAATDRAKASGTLGGYGDVWQGNQLGNNNASREIGVVNNYSEGARHLLGPEQDLAAAAAYKPPSIWGQLLTGAGNMMGAAAGGRAAPWKPPAWNSGDQALNSMMFPGYGSGMA